MEELIIGYDTILAYEWHDLKQKDKEHELK